MTKPFTIEISDQAIDDIKERLRLARFPAEIDDAGWSDGMSIPFLRRFVHFWAEEFDFAAAMARLNAVPQFTSEIDGQLIHFIHVQSANADATPLLLANGWPSNFVEYVHLIPLLSDYHLVIPSMPGYGFSGKPTKPGSNLSVFAGQYLKLMDGLGYERFLAHGTDLGAGIVLALVRDAPQRIIGAHYANVWSGYPRPQEPTPEEAAYFKRTDGWSFAEGAYAMEHATKPSTIGAALNDTPSGLASWILEKFHTWSDLKDGEIESVYRLDDLATLLSVYWFGETIASSQRLYKEAFADPEMRQPVPRHDVPQGVLVPADCDNPAPRAWAERNLQNVIRFNEARRGGHFPALEVPQLLADDIRAFHRAIV